MNNAIDAFEQIRDARGALPVKAVEIIEGDEPARLRFTLRGAQEGASTPSDCSLEMLAQAGAEEDKRAAIEALAQIAGPLFGDGAPESLEAWQLAANAAQLGMSIHASVQERDPNILLQGVGRHLIVDAARGKERGSWVWAQVPVDAGGGDEYRKLLPAGAWSRRLSERRWAFAQVEEAPGALDTLSVGILHLDFKDACLADAGVVAQELKKTGLPSIPLEACKDERGGRKPLLDSGSRLRFEEQPFSEDDPGTLSDLLCATAQVHMQGAHLDMIKSTARQQFMAFPALLGYLWFDFVRRGEEVKIGICSECGLPFSKNTRGGSRKKFCSPSCSAKHRSRERKEAQG